MKTKKEDTVIKVDIDTEGRTTFIIKQGRFSDMKLWGSLLSDVAKTIAEAHQSISPPPHTIELIRMGFLEEIDSQ